MREDKDLRWRTLHSEYLIRRPWLTARRDEVQLPDGRVYDEYYVLEYPDWINVIAITDDGRYILERQWRHALGIVSTEICAGVVEKGEQPLAAAQRELEEETGYGGGDWSLLMVTAPNPGAMTNHCYSYVARGVRRVSDRHLDPTEDIDVLFLSREEVIEKLLHGDFLQALMVAPLWRHFAQDLLK